MATSKNAAGAKKGMKNSGAMGASGSPMTGSGVQGSPDASGTGAAKKP
ncbi:hypothetical protein H4V98_000296 [Polaromonas sp. CG_23.6]|nr:hypothetical protein [Polaromonas sp. CG_23.6]